jgi:hypothetical protein
MQMTGTSHGVRAVLLALVALVAASCASLKDPFHKEDMFREKQRSFSQYIRWGNMRGASAFLVEDQVDEFLQLAPKLTDVRFTDYEILEFEMKDEMTRATVDVVYTGYRLSSPVERSMRLRQEWNLVDGEWKVRLEMEPVRKALGLAAK